MRDGPVFVERIDYEAAEVPHLDTLAMFASKMLGITHKEAMGREDIKKAARIVAQATIAAALVGVREAKDGQELTFFGPLIVPARYDPAYDVELPAGRYFVIRLDEEVEE